MRKPRSKSHSLNASGILALRQRLNLTQAQFATFLGVAEVTVWRWEHGQRSPRTKLRRKLYRLVAKYMKEA